MSRHPIVDGATRLLGIVGHPIVQVRAPEVWTALCRRHGLNILCVPFHVLPENLAASFAGMRAMKNLIGMIATIPHKPACVDLVDALTERAAVVRAVNFIAIGPDARWTGDIVDGLGFVENLKAHGVEANGRRTLLVGAGGVGAAIAFALAEAGVGEIVLYDKDASRSSGLAGRLAKAGWPVRTAAPDPAGFDLVVNASPMGMGAEDPLPLDVSGIEPGSVVADVVAHETELLRRAAACGCMTIDGTGMMEQQLPTMARQLGLGDYDFSADTARRVAGENRG
jgi:shikimate dehydrogenase